MATFKINVFKHQQRKDGTFPVSIRVTWKRNSAYINTEYRVHKKQLTKNYELKDPFIVRELNNRIAKFEEIKVQKLKENIEFYTAKELAAFLTQQSKNGGDICFTDFAEKYIENLKPGYKTTFTATLNNLKDFTGSDKILISEITSSFLLSFEKFLKSERELTRLNQFGRPVETTTAPSSDATIRKYMSNIRAIFNAAMDEYNDEDRGELVIKHYPFRKYKIKSLPETKKRNLSIEEIRRIQAIPDSQLTDRGKLGRDVFLLSFMLVGTNAVDLYEMPSGAIKDGRITYNRQKTTDRRVDRAEISIKIEPEVLELVEKYKGDERAFRFHELYTTSRIFYSNINKGLKVVAQAAGLDVPLSTYYARHSWASIARNDCRISKDDVHLALNHVDDKTRITDIYIARDWSIIDDANRKVLDYLISNKI
jgi:integrase